MSFSSYLLDLSHCVSWGYVTICDVGNLGQILVANCGVQSVIKPDVHLLSVGDYIVSTL